MRCAGSTHTVWHYRDCMLASRKFVSAFVDELANCHAHCMDLTWLQRPWQHFQGLSVLLVSAKRTHSPLTLRVLLVGFFPIGGRNYLTDSISIFSLASWKRKTKFLDEAWQLCQSSKQQQPEIIFTACDLCSMLSNVLYFYHPIDSLQQACGEGSAT